MTERRRTTEGPFSPLSREEVLVQKMVARGRGAEKTVGSFETIIRLRKTRDRESIGE